MGGVSSPLSVEAAVDGEHDHNRLVGMYILRGTRE